MNLLGDQTRGIKTLTFDCYGTLIDWYQGLCRCFDDVFGGALRARHEELVAAYVASEAELEKGPYRSYREVLRLALAEVARQFDVPLPAVRAGALAESLPGWAPFPDTRDALSALAGRFRLGVMSNIDRDLFALTRERLGIEFDFVITAEDVGSYKPAYGHFQRLLEVHGPAERVLHVGQSLFHDGEPARQLGIAYVWINRYKDTPAGHATPLAEFGDLKSFAAAVLA